MISDLNLISILIYETLGTFILILFGNGSVVTELLYHADTKSGPNILSINIAYGLAVTFGIYTAHKTGGHINPVVSIVALLEGCLNCIQTIVFIFSQCLGAFLASFVLHMNYKNGFDRHLEERDYLNGICGDEKGSSSNLLAVAGVFSTFPHSSLVVDGKPKILNMWFDQILGTFMLIFLIKMVTNKNSPHCVDAKNAPIVIGLIVIMIGQALGVNCGYDKGPQFLGGSYPYRNFFIERKF